MRRIAIIGFGFSGLMVVANLVREATAPLAIYIIDDASEGFGVAYGTNNTDHLLNVRASNMSAYAIAPLHLVEWLAGDEGTAAATSLGLHRSYGAEDFVPRALYALYLQHIWRSTQEIAAHKKIDIKVVPSRAVALQTGDDVAVLTARGDAIAADKVLLAVGHEPTPILTHIESSQLVQHPWDAEALADAATWQAPVLLMGTGLTAIDMVFSLRNAGYAGEIVMSSRRGWLPKVHAAALPEMTITPEEIAAHKTLQQMLRLLRTKMRESGDWRAVVDALRPYTQTVWQRFTLREQQRFLRRLAPLWNIHRHRMAPEIAARMEAEMAAGTLKIMASRRMEVTLEDGQILMKTHCEGAPLQVRPSRIINCTGLSLSLARSSNPLLRQLYAEGLVEEHATCLGVAVDKYYRAWGRAHPSLFVVGSLLTGQLLESTAVPELRVQAAAIAQQIV